MATVAELLHGHCSSMSRMDARATSLKDAKLSMKVSTSLSSMPDGAASVERTSTTLSLPFRASAFC